MTIEALADAVAAQRPEPKRDRWGRYVIPHPITGKAHTWTRATTFARSVSDTFGLTKWELRMATLGLARRPDLLAQAATVTDPDDPDAKKLLGRLAEEAKEAAGSSVRANLGTALHSMTEHIDAGRDFLIPEAHRADLDAYRDGTAGLTIDPAHIERIVTVLEYDVAGTFDRLVTFDGRLMVADLKTGRDLAYSWGEIAVQLALYAHGQTMWDQATEQHEPMPEVDQERALVIHLPVGEARCTLHFVDVAAGWEMAATCGTVRAWRKRRDLAERVAGAKRREARKAEQVTAAAAPAPDRQAWIRDRVKAVGAAGDEARGWLARLWPEGVPIPSAAESWTDDQIDRIAEALTSVEGHARLEFHDGDPAKAVVREPELVPERIERAPQREVLDDGEAASDGALDAVRRALDDLSPADRARLKVWAADGSRQGRPWATRSMTVRLHAISRAAIACTTALASVDDTDDLTRAALAEVIDEDLQSSWLTGAVIGSLTLDEAKRLETLAAGWTAGDEAAVARLVARVAASITA